MKTPQKKMTEVAKKNGWENLEHFTKYLDILIIDLQHSGYEATAKDVKTARDIIHAVE